MLTSMIFTISLLLATLLCALVAGFLYAFAVVAMPGIGQLGDGEFIRAFQGIDGVIQNNQPLFMLVWIGSILAIVLAAVMGFGQLVGVQRVMLIVAAGLYLLGVQAPTMVVNIPLNNEIQLVNVDALEESDHQQARARFETRWNRSNQVRTVLAIVVTLILLILIFLL